MNANTSVSSAVEQEGEIVFVRLPGHRCELNAVAANVALAADCARRTVLCQWEIGGDGPSCAIRTCAIRTAAADRHLRIVAQTLIGLMKLLRGDTIRDGQAALGRGTVCGSACAHL